jgi:hypothetical protein
MKKLKLFTALLLLTTITTNAQITKGNWMVGGSGNFTSYEGKDSNGEVSNKGFGMSIRPNLGYFLVDKFVVGSGIGFSFSKQEGYNKSSSFSVSPFVRFYFLKPENKVNLLAEANYNFSQNFNDGVHDGNYNGYGFKVGPVIYFNNSVGLEITLDYNSTTTNPVSSSSSSGSYLQLGLGFQIHLEK